ncbi:MAG: T9SS type A sorting domain-containing protein [Bacteroidota bacterium]|nr:T9SS type A sorting domain-containing protein [Bacteroidota bacterium]MDP4205926.1 T9SS type A sorting domain-containing protein [Bacteroidota bacterium]
MKRILPPLTSFSTLLIICSLNCIKAHSMQAIRFDQHQPEGSIIIYNPLPLSPAERDSLDFKSAKAALLHGNNHSEHAQQDIYIYPNPLFVQNPELTIKAEKDISLVRITNIIGNEVARFNFKSQQKNTLTFRINFQNKGIFLIDITLIDNTRVVKRLMVK